jgi:hypothetical protein
MTPLDPLTRWRLDRAMPTTGGKLRGNHMRRMAAMVSFVSRRDPKPGVVER